MSNDALETKIEEITWQDYDALCNQLIAKIEQSGWDVHYVVGVPRGGLMVAVVLSYRLGKPFVCYDDVVIAKEGKNLLVVDDIVKTGNTMSSLKQHYSSKIGVKNNIKFASLFCLKGSKCFPEFFVKELDYAPDLCWIVLPFESDKEFLLRLPSVQMCYNNLMLSIQNSFVCPNCGDNLHQIKKGKTNSGSQRAHCKICNYRYTPFKKGYSDDVKHSAVLAYLSGYSSGKISSMLGVDSDTVLAWVASYAGKDKIRRNKFH